MASNESPQPAYLKFKTATILLGVMLIAFGAGYFFAGKHGAAPTPDQHAAVPTTGQEGQAAKPEAEARKPTIWTCAMHPQIRLPKPGKCPICFMDLIALESGGGQESSAELRQVSLSPAARKLAQIETSEVKRDHAKVSVRMVGMVFENEKRVAALTARVDGRLDEIFVDFTGVKVNQGDPMVRIWSPTLIKSQVELFETLKDKGVESTVVKGGEEKLIQYGLTKDQVKEIREKKKPILYVTLRAPISGVVMKKMAVLGQFVKEGQEMYIINDLSNVWIKLSAYETDMPWIRYGQDVTFTTPSVPGRSFKGKVLFIDPTLDEKTRSVKIRVEAANPDLSLKPGTFVSAQLEAEVDSQGRVIKSEWAGKYICPVHPADEPGSEPGTCPESKAPLRPAADFGYVDEKEPKLPLIIPAAAPLITGKRAIVYVEAPKADRPTYELREIVLGPRAGDTYVVYEGLKEGEKVVTRGGFKIDSAAQILAKPSMMMPPDEKQAEKAETQPRKTEEETIEKVEVNREFLETLTPVVTEYLALKDALVEEQTEPASKHAGKLDRLLASISTQGLEEKAQKTWQELAGPMTEPLKRISDLREIEAQRKEFGHVSELFAKMVMGFRHAMDKPLILFYCPMAFDKEGAYWVEGSEERRNPYFGRKQFKGLDMLPCGELQERIPPEPQTVTSQGEGSSTEKKSGETSAGSPPGGSGQKETAAPSHEQGSQSHGHGKEASQ